MKRSYTATVALAATAVLFVVIYVWARWTSIDLTRMLSLLEWLSPATFTLGMCVMLAAIFVCRADICRILNFLNCLNWLLMAAVVMIALTIRLVLVPATQRVYYDEHTYLQVSRGIAEEGRARVASYGVITQQDYHCIIGFYPHWSAGWSTLLAGAMYLSGYAEWTGVTVNLVLSLATILFVALIAASLFPGTFIWLKAAAVYACLPANQLWSRTSASEVFAVFTAALAVLTAIGFSRIPNRRISMLLAASVAIAAQVRNEAVILLPICAVFVIFIGGRYALRTSRLPMGLVLILLLTESLHLGCISRSYQPGVDGAGFGSNYSLRNLASAANYFRHEPVVFVVLFLAIVGVSKLRLKREAIPLYIWGVSTFLLPMFHFGGSYSFPGGERFLLACLPAVAIAAGAGLYAIHLTLVQYLPREVLAGLYFTLFVIALLTAGPHAVSEDQKTDIPRQDCMFLKEALDSIPAVGMVITADPPAVIVEGRSAALITWAADKTQRLRNLADRYPASLYLFIAPSSSPSQWPDGAESEKLLLSMFSARIITQQHSPAGSRTLYRLLPFDESSDISGTASSGCSMAGY